MKFDSVINSMNQQTRVLKEIEALLDHNDKQESPGHSVKPEDVETLRTYVTTMKTAVNTATTLAKYYKDASTPQAKAKTEAPPAEVKQEEAPAGVTEEKTPDKPKRKRRSKKQEAPKEEPVKEEPAAEEPAQGDSVEEFDFLM